MRHLEVVAWSLSRVVSWNLQTPKQRRGSGPFRGTWAVYLQINCELLEVDRDILGRHLLSIMSLEYEIRRERILFFADCASWCFFFYKPVKLFPWGSICSEISSHGAGASHLCRRWSIFLMPSSCCTEMSESPLVPAPNLTPNPHTSLEKSLGHEIQKRAWGMRPGKWQDSLESNISKLKARSTC